MIYYQALWNDAHHFMHGLLKNSGELERMSGHSGDRVLQALARVVRDVQHGRLSAEEGQWRSRIEQRRASMNRSHEVLKIADYGAQSPLKKLSDEEMYSGRIVERTVGEVCRSSSKPPKWSYFLFRLVRELAPETCLELGTCLGISGAYIAAAMQLNGKGRLITIEGSDALAERAKANFAELGCTTVETVTGRFQDALPAVLGKTGAIDIVFIDGHHDGPATLRYFETIAPSLRDDAVVIFDDIAWSKEMHDAWKSLRAHRRVRFSIDMFDMGLCCIGESAHECYRLAV
jgi:predicted O-methyltransferase YrrM